MCAYGIFACVAWAVACHASEAMQQDPCIKLDTQAFVGNKDSLAGALVLTAAASAPASSMGHCLCCFGVQNLKVSLLIGAN